MAKTTFTHRYVCYGDQSSLARLCFRSNNPHGETCANNESHAMESTIIELIKSITQSYEGITNSREYWFGTDVVSE
jgi:hypothetical protein